MDASYFIDFDGNKINYSDEKARADIKTVSENVEILKKLLTGNAFSVVRNLDNVTDSNLIEIVDKNSSFKDTLIPNEGYTVSDISVTMGGVDITDSVVTDNIINISDVTGNIEITASAEIVNLYNHNSPDIITGLYNGSTTLTPMTVYSVTHPINVVGGETYVCERDQSFIPKQQTGVYLDSNGNAVALIVPNIIEADHLGFTVPTGKGYCAIRLNMVSMRKQRMRVFKGEKFPKYDGYISTITGVNNLKNKTISFIGDSICYGANTKMYSYPDLIGIANNMDWINKGQSNLPLYQILPNMPPYYNYDYLIVEGGINDIVVTKNLGDITPNGTTTFDTATSCGVLEKAFYDLQNSFATCKIGFILTNNCPSKRSASMQAEYFAKFIEIFEKWGIPYIDLREYEDGFLNITYFADTDLHPNFKGYTDFYSPYIEKWINTL